MISESTQKNRYVRAKILLDHLQELTVDSALADGLTYASAISLLSNGSATVEQELPIDDTKMLPGGLSETDLRRFIAPVQTLSKISQKRLVKELDVTLLSIADFYWGENNLSKGERFERACDLPEELQAQLEGLRHDRDEVEARQDRISRLVEEINEIHPRLQAHLIQALRTLPPVLNANRAASDALLATTIETTLVKLTLLHTRAHSEFYRSDAATLAGVHEKRRADEQRLAMEEAALDREIAEYESVMGLAGGGYTEVMEDWVRVKRESDECRRDLRRLGD